MRTLLSEPFLFPPLKIGSLEFPHGLIQGPLAGYSCWPMRLLAQEYGQPAFCYTEMLSAKHLASVPLKDIQKHVAPRFLIKHPDEGTLCVQLSGTDPEELKTAIERILPFGANLIDLNCGCPVAKIRQKGAGSKLLEDPKLLKKLVSAMKSVSPVPISIKIRIDQTLDTPISQSLQAALAAEDAGVDFIAIHGRHWTESYETPCRAADIRAITEKLHIPVIANGDAHDTESTVSLLKNTGAQGVMISRASVGQPWIFQKILLEAQGKNFNTPSCHEIGDIFLRHLEDLISLEGEKIAILQSRKLIKYYARFLEHAPSSFQLLVEQSQHAEHYAEMKALVEKFFKVFKD
jgi:tRNA-dihydrouridine synthase B